MDHFNETLKTSHGFLTFYFNAKPGNNETHYLVSTVLQDGKALLFEMEKAGSGWFLTKKDTTGFLVSLEVSLSTIINQHTYHKKTPHL